MTLGLFGTGTSHAQDPPLTITCSPVGDGSLTGLETVEIECLLTANVDIDLQAFKLNLPCGLPTRSGDMKVVAINIDQGHADPSFLLQSPFPVILVGTTIPRTGNDCTASANFLPSSPPPAFASLAAGETRYLATYTYQAAECAAGDFNASLQGFDNPPTSADSTSFKDAARQFVTFEAIGFTLAVPTGSCCNGGSCLTGEDGGPVNQICCGGISATAVFFPGKTCDDDGACECTDDEQCDDGIDCTVDRCDTATRACFSIPSDSFCVNDDGLFCNGEERCLPLLGGCQPGPDPCPGQLCDETRSGSQNSAFCLDCITSNDCEDFLFCNGPALCVGEVCVDDPPCPPSGNPDLLLCNEAINQCAECLSNGDCDDGLYCNGAEVCNGVLCQPGPDPCQDPLKPVCDEDESQSQSALVCVQCLSPEDCDDSFCLGSVSCVFNICSYLGDPCVAQGLQCDEVGDRCVNCFADSECDDGVPCTENLCDEGICRNPGVVCEIKGQICNPANDECVDCLNGTDCDDGNFCNGVETCNTETNQCAAGSDPCPGQMCDEDIDICVDCFNDDNCNGSFCNPITCIEGVCIPGGSPCDAGQACDETRDLCVDCTIDEECDDGTFCNGAETCVDSACVAGTSPCTGQVCDETGDACVDCLTGADCPDDGDACTSNTCIENVCGTTPVICDDTDNCTTDTCDPATGCSNAQVTCSAGEICDGATGNCVPSCTTDAACDDSVFCNGAETCNTTTGQCVDGSIPCAAERCNESTDTCDECAVDADCSDGVACTDDTCAGGSCVFTANNANCSDDGAFCNGGESCSATAGCVSSGNPCATDEFCNESTDTCDACLNAGDCDDNIPCTNDTCVGGVCVFNVDDDRCPNDGNFCNGIEVCDPTDGCTSLGDPCTQGTFCNETTNSCDECQVNANCDDGVGCTDDRCVDGECTFVSNSQNCPDDGLFCNGAETCDVLDDCVSSGDPCVPFGLTCNEVADSCDECLIDVNCDDGDVCTDDTCGNGQCINTPNGGPGCPPVDPGVGQPLTNDADGDGVTDQQDQCANTPAGAAVDNTGCPTGNPISTNACGASGSGCGPAGPAMILILMGLMALRFVGPRGSRGATGGDKSHLWVSASDKQGKVS